MGCVGVGVGIDRDVGVLVAVGVGVPAAASETKFEVYTTLNSLSVRVMYTADGGTAPGRTPNQILFRSSAEVNAQNIAACLLGCIAALDVLRNNPFQNPPPYEKLGGEFKGLYSRRINAQHRLVYDVRKREKIVRILRIWTHYE